MQNIHPALQKFNYLANIPFGKWLFTKIVTFKAPYFASIHPIIEALDVGFCKVRMNNTRRVHNHIGTVHVIALCNMAEMAAGVMTEVSVPHAMRWIPKGMTVSYLKPVNNKIINAICKLHQTPHATDKAYELICPVDVVNEAGEVCFHADITMWVSPKISVNK